MGVRTNTDLSFQIGRDNGLTNLLFDGALGQILDTLERAVTGTAVLAGGEANFEVPFGDVSAARLVYIEADGPITVTPGGALATAAQIDGAGGAYPTGFSGSGSLSLTIDETTFVVGFTSSEQSLQQVLNRINSAAALQGLSTVAFANGSQLRLTSPTVGAASLVSVTAASAPVLTALGLSVASANGAEGVPGQTPLQLLRPASTATTGTQAVKAYMLATLQTTGLVIDNLDPSSAVNVTWAIAGDLAVSPIC
jgi:hypothetical protein